MKVKEIDRTVNVSWSPITQHPILLAAGTAAQQLDASFSTSATLELYALNLTEPGLDMELRVSAPSDYRFHKIAWGHYGLSGDRGGGVIVGGCDGGRIHLYSAGKLLAGEDGLIVSQEKHTGPVQALDFNPYQANLLATAAPESEIYIWDLNNMSTPMTPGAKAQPYEDVVWIAWNRQVQHILASAFPQRCVMWDLRKNEPIIKLSDSTTRIRWKVVAWHPEVATQLCLASEEDQSPVIQLWDLRFATSPLKVLQNHQQGVLSIAWCAQDPDLLVSCGKDNRILCWNPNSNVAGGEVVCDVATTNRWNFDVSWCPRNPVLIASSSFDGHVSVYSLMGGQQQMQTSNKIADSFPGMEAYVQAPVPQQQQVTVDLRKAPKWLKRPVGASFGFGGKLVMFENVGYVQNAPNQTGQVVVPRIVYVSQVVTEPGLIARSNHLENALQMGQFAEFCQAKAATSATAHERCVWNFIKANFEDQPQAELLRLLGFKPEEVVSKLNRFTDKPANARLSDGVDALTDQLTGLGREAPEGDAVAATGDVQYNSVDAKSSQIFKIATGDDTDGLICQALLLGYTEAAVELCLQDGRMADAIILAMTGSSSLLAKTQDRYFKQSKGYLSSLISAVVTEDWSHVVQLCDVDSWKEAMAAVLTQAKGTEEFPSLCERLGQRLELEGRGSQKLNAQLCYICAGNLNKMVESWTTTAQVDSPDKLQDLVELVMVLKKAAELQGRTVEVSGQLATLLSQYAAVLASQGSLCAALSYLGDSNEEQIAALRERLYRTLGHKPAYVEQQQAPVQAPAPSRLPTSNTRRPSGSYYHSQVPQTPAPVLPPVPGYPTTAVTQPQTYAGMQQQQPPPPSSLMYNSTSQAFPAPVVSQPCQGPKAFSPAPPVQPLNPQTQAVPPMPAFSAPAPATSVGGSGMVSRSKPYMVDPSVQGGVSLMSYSSSVGSVQQPSPYLPPAPQSAPYPSPQMTPPVPSYTTSPMPGYPAPQNVYGHAEGGAMPNPMVQEFPMGCSPPGWNDPPLVKNATHNQFELSDMSAEHAGTRIWKGMTARSQPKSDYMPPVPITHPLYGSVPLEPAPPGVSSLTVSGGGGGGGNFPDPSGAYGQLHQQRPPPSQTPTASHQQQPTVRPTEIPKAKGPVPEEHMYLQIVFDELRNRCALAANNPQLRRKLEDVARKLEMLYDALREHKLSPGTLQGLHQMVQMVQIGDYTGGLGLHTQLVSGPDFSQIASFMPGLKVLLQLALQLGVYLQ